MKVLFVCTGNAYRSPLAEALLKKLRPDIQVESAGLNVAIPIARETKSYLKRIDAAQHLKSHPESLNEKNLRDYDLIVAMQVRHKDYILNKCPECARNIVLWNIEDPYCKEQGKIEKIFHEIENEVKTLSKSIKFS